MDHIKLFEGFLNEKNELAKRYQKDFINDFEVTDTLAEISDDEGTDSDRWGDEADTAMGNFFQAWCKKNNVDTAKLDKELLDSEINYDLLDHVTDLCTAEEYDEEDED